MVIDHSINPHCQDSPAQRVNPLLLYQVFFFILDAHVIVVLSNTCMVSFRIK